MSSPIRQFARQVLETESASVRDVIAQLDERFDEAVRLILDCPGAVLTSGIGKAGHVARKLSASFSSTGTPSHFLNPAEALHGDWGRSAGVMSCSSFPTAAKAMKSFEC